MRLKREQSEKLLRELGIWVTEACDKCGQLLGSVRWRDRVSVGNGCQVHRRIPGKFLKRDHQPRKCLFDK